MLEVFELTEYCQFRRTFHSILIHNLSLVILIHLINFNSFIDCLAIKQLINEKILLDFMIKQDDKFDL